MNAMRKLRGLILADSNARIETAKAVLAEAEAHKAIVLDLLAKGREELVENLAEAEAHMNDGNGKIDIEGRLIGSEIKGWLG
jgi:hypothetical protein